MIQPGVASHVFDALIIGGGPAGGTMAALLAGAGWSVCVVEKARFPRPKVCGEFISATTAPLLRELGLEQTWLERGGPAIDRLAIFHPHGRLDAPMPATRGATPFGRALRRDILDDELLRIALTKAATIFTETTAIGLRHDGERCVCRVRDKADGSTADLLARIVIAAHGSWEISSLPTAAPLPTSWHDQVLGFKAHFRDTSLPQSLMPMLLFPGGYGGMVHVDDGTISVSFCIRRSALQDVAEGEGESAGERALEHIKRHCPDARRVLTRATLQGRWLAAGPLRPGIHGDAPVGVFKIGNAYGESHPIIAEGISMAMQSAFLLSRLLISREQEIRADGGQDALIEIAEQFRAKWRKAFALRLRLAGMLARVNANAPLGRGLLTLAKMFPSSLTAGAALSGKTSKTK